MVPADPYKRVQVSMLRYCRKYRLGIIVVCIINCIINISHLQSILYISYYI